MYYISPISNNKFLLPVKEISLEEYLDNFTIEYSSESSISFLYQKYKQYFDCKEQVRNKIKGYYYSMDTYKQQVESLNKLLSRHISTFFDLGALEIV